jgi:hypothetical protein
MNPHHNPETSSSAITQSFECVSLGPDHPEVVERERQRLERLKETPTSGVENPEEGK